MIKKNVEKTHLIIRKNAPDQAPFIKLYAFKCKRTWALIPINTVYFFIINKHTLFSQISCPSKRYKCMQWLK